MKLKTYQAWTMGEALAFVKTDLGADAVILHTRTFERGGFFGIGKRAVVEITAARAQDMPRIESRVERRSDAGALGGASRAPAAGAGSGARSGEAIRMSAAARAYGVQSGGGAQSSGVATPAAAPLDVPLDVPLDMESEREKTRRLAQAMAISLEKQAAARGSATRNEDAVRDAAMAAARNPPVAPAKAESVPSAGPAQRFVLVPESGGVQRLTAAVVRVPDVAPVGATSASAASASATSASATSVPAATAPAASISPTHSSVDVVKSIVESKPVAGEGELDAISDFVGRVLKRGGSEASPAAHAGSAAAVSVVAPAASPAHARPGALGVVHAHLLEQEVGPELADRVMNHIARQLDVDHAATGAAVAAPTAVPTEADVRRAVEDRLVALLPDDSGDAFEVRLGRHGPRRIAFVGPTGVGKTTTLAKIAAQLKLKRGLRVGIVAADTYRIAAVDQLRTYAEILGLPVEVASSPKDAARACASLSDVDVILIDTAGRSQNDHMKISELRAFLGSAQPDDTHLVLSATASARTLAREAEAFGPLGVDRLVLTKLDEAAAFGALLTLVERLGKRVSFFTQGQEVPDHIELGRNRRLAALVMGSEVR